MPDEPNKNMDALLRSYAKKRREAPELPVHPATRAMLQGEVHRKFPPRQTSGNGWRAYLPQIAFGSALCLVIGLTIAVLKLPPQENLPAKQEVALNEEPQPEAVPVSGVVAELDEKKEEELLLFRDRQLSLEPPKEAAPEQRSAGLDDSSAGKRADAADLRLLNETATQTIAQRRDEDAQERFAFKDITAPAPALAPAQNIATETAAAAPSSLGATVEQLGKAKARPEVLARARELTNLGAALRTHFVQTNLPTSVVLRSFQVEQLGEQLRVVDSDGSVYAGGIQLTQSVGQDARVILTKTVEERDLSANSAVYNFEASGSNRTLARPVVIRGQYFERTNLLAPGSVDLLLSAPNTPARPQAKRTTSPQARRAIVGRALIGETNEVPVRALSVE
jgi:hypothetical protein